MDEWQSLVSKASILGGLIGGLIHAGVAVALWSYFGLDSLWELFLIKPLYGLYIFLGMFALGFVPTMLYVEKDFVTPALVVTLFLLIAGLGSWQAGPVRAPIGGPTPFGMYILLWVVIITLAGLISRFEHVRTQRATG